MLTLCHVARDFRDAELFGGTLQFLGGSSDLRGDEQLDGLKQFLDLEGAAPYQHHL